MLWQARPGPSDGDVSINYGIFDGWIVKSDPAGNILWEISLGGSADDEAFSVAATPSGCYNVLAYTASNDGMVSGNHGESDIWLVSLDEVTGIGNNNTKPLIAEIYPNPATSLLTVVLGPAFQKGKAALTLCDKLGQTVFTDEITGSPSTIDVGNLASGVYLLKVDNGKNHEIRSLVKE